MKRISFYITVLLLCSVVASAWMINAHWEEVRCAICEKEIYHQVDTQYGPYMPSIVGGGLFLLPDKERVYKLTLLNTIYVCKDHRDQYNQEFQRTIKQFVAEKRSENSESIEENIEKNRLKDIKERQQQIEALEGELKGLTEEE